MRTIAIPVFVLFLLGARAAVAQDVRYDFDKDKDFATFKTYKWVPIKGADTPDDLTGKRIVAVVEAGLAMKGLTKTEADTADLYFGYETAVGTEKQYTSYNTGWDYGPGWGLGTDWPT